MKTFGLALVAVFTVTGLGFAADDAARTPTPAAPPGESSAARHHAGDFEPSRLPALIKQNDQMIAHWEEALGRVRTDETKKVLGDAIAKAKEFRAGLEQLSDTIQAGKEDEARQLTGRLRERRPELLQYAATLPSHIELDQMKTLQAERGKDNPELNAHYQRIIDLLNKRLDLQNQLSAVNRDLQVERQALPKSNEAAPGQAPAAEPPKPEPAPEPKSKANPNDAT
jgi:hypothetical protein